MDVKGDSRGEVRAGHSGDGAGGHGDRDRTPAPPESESNNSSSNNKNNNSDSKKRRRQVCMRACVSVRACDRADECRNTARSCRSRSSRRVRKQESSRLRKLQFKEQQLAASAALILIIATLVSMLTSTSDPRLRVLTVPPSHHPPSLSHSLLHSKYQ